MANLLEGGFAGEIFPINPKKSSILNIPAYSSISLIKKEIDLAIIVTPAPTVPGIVKECVETGVKSAIIISAGFKEMGPHGEALEKELLQYAQTADMPIIGPNCLGVMNPIYGLNATFARGMAQKGNIAFISQSGAMCTAVLDWSLQEGIGFSSFVSIGSMADVNWGDLLDYLGEDPYTQSILLYMETVGDPRSFLSAAREIALEKTIIVIKAGRSKEAAQAAASHTGSLAGSDEVFDAALERVGVLRVDTIHELFSMASAIGRQPLPRGPRLSIVTNAGGPAVLATDATVFHGAELTPIHPTTETQLNAFLPAAWSHSNPIDILGDASPERYVKTIDVLAKDEQTDGILVVLSPQDMTDPTTTAQQLRKHALSFKKPLLASWMGGNTVSEGIEILTQSHIPTFSYPDDAAKTFAAMWKLKGSLRRLYETPTIRRYESFITQNIEDRQRQREVQKLLEIVRQEKRTILSEYESKRILSAYGIPVVQTLVAHTIEEAVEKAEELGYPVVLKLLSETITHKTDVGGVQLNLASAKQVQEAFQSIYLSVAEKKGEEHFQGVTVQRMIDKESGYELILGSSLDPQFGPVVLFGMGGQLVEVFRDRALALPPLTPKLARFLMEKTKIYEALKGVRGKRAVNLHSLEDLLVRFSQLVAENRWIVECDINPLLAAPDEIIALDARVILAPPDTAIHELPKLSIRPYPMNYVKDWRLKNGVPITLRPIVPEDEPLLVAFHKELSENSVRQRFFAFIALDERVTHERLLRICFTDYDREMPIVAEIDDPQQGERRIVGVAKLSRTPHTREAYLTLIIADAYHHLGLGTEFVHHLLHIAKEENITHIYADILSENTGMIAICKKEGFQLTPSEDGAIMRAYLQLP